MNLAEIRKKAQKEKQAAAPISVPDTPGPAQPLQEDPFVYNMDQPDQEPAERMQLPAQTQEAPAQGFQAVPIFDTQPPAVETVVAPHRFDPVAVIMAGRRAAGSVAEAELSPDTAVPAEADTSEKYLCFRVVREEYAISLMDIKEIIKPRCVTEIPHAPAFITGIISLRGAIIPIVDMRLRLGFSAEASTPRERFVVVKKRDGFYGLLVDEVYQVITLAQQPLEKPPAVLEGSDREFVKGIGRYGDRMFILMDLEKVLDINLN